MTRQTEQAAPTTWRLTSPSEGEYSTNELIRWLTLRIGASRTRKARPIIMEFAFGNSFSELSEALTAKLVTLAVRNKMCLTIYNGMHVAHQLGNKESPYHLIVYFEHDCGFEGLLAEREDPLVDATHQLYLGSHPAHWPRVTNP